MCKSTPSAGAKSNRSQQAAQWFTDFDAADERPGELRPGWRQWIANPDNQSEYEEILELRDGLRTQAAPAAVSDDELLHDLASPAQRVEPDNSAGSRARPTDTSNARSWRARLLPALAATVLIGGTGIFLAQVWHRYSDDVRLLTFISPVAEQREITLPDGSRVTLEGDTLVRAQFGKARNLYLIRGGAKFTVRNSPQRPFIVHAGYGSIHALGTQFVVHRYSEFAERVRLWVTEGAVEVEPNYKGRQQTAETSDVRWTPVRLTRNQELAYDSGGRGTQPLTIDPASIPIPGQGFFMYRGRPLGEVIEDIQRYTNKRITIDRALSGLQFTGSVFPADVERWILGLPDIFPTLTIDTGDGAIRIRARVQPPNALKSAQR